MEVLNGSSRSVPPPLGSGPLIWGRWLIVETLDGSPSLQLIDNNRNEVMHHRGGAFAETMYIYSSTVETLLRELENPLIMSMGLGLGYNELMVAAKSLAVGKTCRLQSFESDDELRDSFLGFVRGEENPLTPMYHKICEYLSTPASEIRKWLSERLVRNEWKCDPAFVSVAQLLPGINGYLWDAFSQKTSPDLWTAEMLDGVLAKAGEKCLFASYASLGVLKRALKAANMTVIKRDGFFGKRNSTFAHRGEFSELPDLRKEVFQK